MTARDRGHVEEIINHLKRVENDYRIDLTSEMEWLRGLEKTNVTPEGFQEMLEKEIEWFGKTVESKSYKQTCRYFAEWGKQHQEPVSEELESEIQRYNNSLNLDAEENYDWDDIASNVILAARHFAKWQKEQMESYRIKHCNSITNEQAELEESFVSSHVEKNNRIPTFLDAIEFGIEYGKQQLMKGAKNGVVCDGNDYIKFDDGTWIELDPTMQLNPAFVLKDGDKVKVIVLKED